MKQDITEIINHTKYLHQRLLVHDSLFTSLRTQLGYLPTIKSISVYLGLNCL